MTKVSTVILVKQIAHYHAARYTGFAKINDNFKIITVANGADLQQIVVGNVSELPIVELYPSPTHYYEALENKKIKHDIFSMLELINPDTIVVSGWSNAESIIGILWAKLHFRKVVIMSESQKDDADRNTLIEYAKRLIVKQCDAALVGGKTHRDYLCKLGMEACNVHLGYDAVDNYYFANEANLVRKMPNDTRSRYNLPHSYFLASGRFIEKKNFVRLITAHSMLCEQQKNCPDLVIIGGGNLHNIINEARSMHFNSKKVHLPGVVEYADLPAYYGLAEAFVHVATSEQWGLVISEALASGIPVIASDRCGATRELIQNGYSGIVSGVEVDEILYALNTYFCMNSKQRKTLSINGYRSVGNYSPERFGRGLCAAIDSASNNKFMQPTFQARIVLKALQYKTFTTVK